MFFFLEKEFDVLINIQPDVLRLYCNTEFVVSADTDKRSDFDNP